MRALVKAQATQGLTLSNIEIPEYKENEVLIKIKKTGICGTDLHIYNWDSWAQTKIPIPMHIGHEFCGEIVALGSQVKELKIGDKVSGEGHITCGHCRQCRSGRIHLCPFTISTGIDRPGCFAEYLSFPASNVFKVPDFISEDIASIFDPFGNAIHASLSYNLVDKDIFITGAGPIGIMAAAICRSVGARHVVITDVNDYRLSLAKTMGATVALNVKDCVSEEDTHQFIRNELKANGIAESFEIGLEMSGSTSAINCLLQFVTHGGDIAWLGIGDPQRLINWDHIIFKGLNLKGIYGREIFETWYKMVSIIKNGLDLTPIITHQFHYAEYEKAFALMNSRQCGKVILNWAD